METPAINEYFTFLKEQGYLLPEVIPGGRYKAIFPFLFTHAIILGRLGDREGYEDRWCYKGLGEALQGFYAWDGTGEPDGWIRHPATSRRRPEGIPETEYINP